MQRHVDRRMFLKLTALTLAGPSIAPGAAVREKRPNILIINGDDLGAQLGCYGDNYVQTPNIDAIAAEGIRFRTAWVSQASCSPSRSSIYTGLYPHQNGQIGLCHCGYSMHRKYPTITGELKKAGYKTGVIGKFHIEPRNACPWDMSNFDRETNFKKRDVKAIAEVFKDFVEQAGDSPFFIMLNYVDPHWPLSSDNYQLPENPLKGDDVESLDFIGINTPEIRRQTAYYYNCVGRLDQGVGLVIDNLKRAGKYDDTLIIVMGDHGAPFTRSKTTCYNMGLSIPFIMSYPKAKVRSSVSSQMVSTVDIFPTILDFANIRKPRNLAGRSLVDFLNNPAAATREYMFAEFNAHTQYIWFPRRTVRDHRYQLVLNLLDRENPVKGVDGCVVWQEFERLQADLEPEVRAAYNAYNRPPEIELFDLEKDPYCFINQADNPNFRKIKQRLITELEKWRRETNDPYLDKSRLAEITAKHDMMLKERSSG
ncbi:Arylsulfatase [Limihaloglobus sulfuriphilus]|uniref:Arylsulfatase n=1 Tax=Limihaloglobus sulfuriphilus TaxID=1851148 RepID=A0A1Q2MCA0_9BACT|nr:sulfatase [Limihaloglobus sulfuriphilus]AQQ70336.1 Arylsulfatase [Limihaloglobus sulfuriphilus]